MHPPDNRLIAEVLSKTKDLCVAMRSLTQLSQISTPLTAIANYLGMIASTSLTVQNLVADFKALNFVECQHRKCLFMRSPDNECLYLLTQHISLSDDNQYLEAVIVGINPKEFVHVLTEPQTIEDLLKAHSQQLRAMDSIADMQPGDSEFSESSESQGLLELSLAAIEKSSSPIVRLVDSTLFDALMLGASDIHFEVQGHNLHIRYRLDGVLQSIRQIENFDAVHQVVSRIKVLADLDISERRTPQDGRFRVICGDREVDFRVSIMPNINSEDAALRVLDRKHLMGQFQRLTLDALSFDDSLKQFIRNVTTLPYGLLLVTGPTGSGKTTTLYAAISEINTGLEKIVTIEDPIEYQLAGTLQIPVNEKKGLTFARGLRSVLRHDPDKIMVGEIRDAETAHIAVQAALTGHQVFTTVHANNVFDVIGRLSNMGVDTFSLAAALSGIVAQRLVRKLCPHCASSITVTGALLASLLADSAHKSSSFNSTVSLREPRGCAQCRGTGYKGRVAIAETLYVDDVIKALLLQKAPASELRQHAVSTGFESLRVSAISLALSGQTSLAEIDRVTPAFQA